MNVFIMFCEANLSVLLDFGDDEVWLLVSSVCGF
jgi:hypothetical protein